MHHILNDIGLWTNNHRCTSTIGNLFSHHSLQMATIIHNDGHQLAFCVPYYLVNGPIKYVFNKLKCALRINNQLISDGTSLIDKMRNAITNIEPFVLCFI